MSGAWGFVWMYVLPTLTMSVTQCVTFVNLMECRYGRRQTVWMCAIFLLLTNALCLAGCWFMQIERTTTWTTVSTTLPAILFFMFLSKYSGAKFITTYFLSDIAIAASDYLGYTLCIALTGQADLFWSFPVREAMMLTTCFAVHSYVCPRYKNALRELKKGWLMLLIVAILACVLMGLLASLPTPIAERPEQALISVVAMLYLELALALIIYAISGMLELQQRHEQEQQMNTQLLLAQKQYEVLISSVEQTRMALHDMKHHLQVIESLSDEGETERLRAYLKSEQVTTAGVQRQLCRHYVTNVLLCHYAQLAERRQITFECQANLPAVLPLEDSVMTVVLGNALSNALEACEKQKEPPREIHVQIRYLQENVILVVENSCLSQPQFEDGVPVSERGAEHGFGTRSIARICQDAGGRCRFAWKDGVFRVELLIPARKK